MKTLQDFAEEDAQRDAERDRQIAKLRLEAAAPALARVLEKILDGGWVSHRAIAEEAREVLREAGRLP